LRPGSEATARSKTKQNFMNTSIRHGLAAMSDAEKGASFLTGALLVRRFVFEVFGGVSLDS